MKMRFWGTRGGAASPGRETMELGGNTACLQIDLGNSETLLLNSGTGIIEYAHYGLDLKTETTFHIVVTNFSWDVIQGFPFFIPIHIPKRTIHVYTPWPEEITRNNFIRLFDGSYSPLRDISNLNAEIKFHQIPQSGAAIGSTYITYHSCNYPSTSYAYKLIAPERTVMLCLKHENTGDDLNRSLMEFARGSDVLIHDAQYTSEQYHRRAGYGHSSIESAIDNALLCQAKALFLTSHDPRHTDDFLKLYLHKLKMKMSDEALRSVSIELASENIVYELD